MGVKSLWPITKQTGNPVNQSKLKTNTRNWRKGRENACFWLNDKVARVSKLSQWRSAVITLVLLLGHSIENHSKKKHFQLTIKAKSLKRDHVQQNARCSCLKASLISFRDSQQLIIESLCFAIFICRYLSKIGLHYCLTLQSRQLMIHYESQRNSPSTVNSWLVGKSRRSTKNIRWTLMIPSAWNNRMVFLIEYKPRSYNSEKK